jgi:hypothetical protein
VKDSGCGLELLRRLVAVAIKKLWLVLFGAFGGFLVSTVVEEFQHDFLYLYLSYYLEIFLVLTSIFIDI